MTDQKPKIDLKSRLGKKTAPMPAIGGSSIPPPMAATPSAVPGSLPSGGMPGAPMQRPSMPRPSAGPGQVTPSGVPVPPFAQPSRPAVDASNPYGAMQPQAVAPARPAAIRIEMGEEVMAARRAGRTKILVLAAFAAAAGGFVGFAVGGGVERGKGADAAVQGAQDLMKDISAANAEVQKLADVLKSAKDKLSKGQYPEEEVSKLGSINIPFTGKNLAGKGIGRFKPEIVSMLIEYANGTTDANSQKEKLQNVLTGNKKGIQELVEQQTKPTVRWAVILSNGPNGPWAGMQPVPTAFQAKEKWPDDFKVGSGKDQTTFKRYSSGNPINNDSPFFLPVDPSTQSAVCPADVVFKLRRELGDLESILRGDNTPGEERTGLIESAQKLNDKLKVIGKDSA